MFLQMFVIILSGDRRDEKGYFVKVTLYGREGRGVSSTHLRHTIHPGSSIFYLESSFFTLFVADYYTM